MNSGYSIEVLINNVLSLSSILAYSKVKVSPIPIFINGAIK